MTKSSETDKVKKVLDDPDVRGPLVSDYYKPSDLEQYDLKPLKFHDRVMTCQAIHAACYLPPKKQSEPALGIVTLLLDRNADINAVAWCVEGDDERRVQPIHLAVAMGNVQTLQLLLTKGVAAAAPVIKGGKHHYLPIHEAAWFDQPACMALLVKSNADITEKNEKGDTVLHVAAKAGAVNVIEQILIDSPEHAVMIDHETRKRLACTVDDDNKQAAKIAQDKSPDKFPLASLRLFWPFMDERAQVRMFLHVARNSPMIVPTLLSSQVATEEWGQALLEDLEADDSPQHQVEEDPEKWECNIKADLQQDPRLKNETRKFSGDDLADLLEHASHAGGFVLDTLTTEPHVVYKQGHPLPYCAVLPLVNNMVHMTCVYVQETEWEGEKTDNLSPRKLHPVLRAERAKKDRFATGQKNYFFGCFMNVILDVVK